MLSRRNIRIKVLQMLYSLDRNDIMTLKDAEDAYKAKVKQSYQLYLFTLHIFTEFCKCAEDDAKKRKAKYLPTELDRQFSDKLYSNQCMESLIENDNLKRIAEAEDFQSFYDEGSIKRLYSEFAKTDEYSEYIALEQTSNEDHIEIYHEIFRFLKGEAGFHEILMDAYSNWIDDDSHVLGVVKRTLKSMPLSDNFMLEYFPPKDTVDDFGLKLLYKAHNNNEKLREIIKPLLENWDIDRLAIVDSIILKMAISEFLYFKSIPLHVTLNEYVELAKGYSTENSKEFINGILDKAMKTLQEQNKINKEGRGLIN